MGLERFRLGGLARGSLSVLGWNVARLGVQLVWMLLLARNLGAQGYGSFSGLSGLAIALSGLVGAGLGLRMYRDVVHDPSCFGLRWAQAQRLLGLSACALIVVFVAGGSRLYPQVAWGLLLAVGLSELLLVPLIQHVAFAYAAHGRLWQAAAVPVGLSVSRVVAAALLPWSPFGSTLVVYGWLHVAASALGVMIIWRTARQQLRPAPAAAAVGRADLRAGCGFLSVSVSGLALGSLDKALVLRLGGAEIAGNYTAAYRLASLAAVPVEALATAVLPRLFLARANRAAASRLLGLLLVLTASYSVCAAAALWWLAPLLPRVLGADFAAAVAATRVLAFYVPAACLYLIGVQVLLGFERLRWRLISDLLGMLTLVGLLAWSLPTAGVVGATQAVLVTQWLLAALVWLGIGVEQWSFIKKPH